MKNKFKKSKIIVPALALITATTVASVTGTVAWFTASRTATVTAESFATAKVDSTMSVTVTADQNSGTETVSGNDAKISVPGKITHGSYNADTNATGSLYVANLNDSVVVTGYKDLGTVENHTVTDQSVTTNKWLAKSATDSKDKVWYGVSWKMNFKYTATVDNETNYLLFDVKNSKFEEKESNGNTLQGLRIAFMTANYYFVVGGNDSETHTTGTGSTSTGNYGNNYAKVGTETAKLEDGDANLSKSALTLGVLPSNGDALLVTCVAWFEGGDSNIVNKINDAYTVMSKVNATLEFYSRKA